MVDKICIINAGGWGTALAVLMASKGYEVRLWARRPELAEEIVSTRENSSYLPGVRIPDNVFPTSDLEYALQGSSVVIIAAISRFIRELAPMVGPLLKPGQLVVSGSKGLDEESLLRATEQLEKWSGQAQQGRIAALSGPNHAEEVSRGIPTATVVACRDEQVARRLQQILSTKAFRVYTNLDLVGVELCGTVKNVIAIAAGMSDGLGYGDNAKAALVTRSLAEISRLVSVMGGQASTVAGLAGIGDIIATCTSRHSRNRAAGEAIARGSNLDQVRSRSRMEVEGFPATRSVYKLARLKGVEMPITQQVHAVLFEGASLQDGLTQLMTRDHTSEPWM
ncbi:MAG: NAD(P)H-dependent glycerol-3-phosphate dehydrogenase [Chloroflexota bacterium]